MLVPKDDFIGLDDQIHLCAGGETPVLKSHQDAVARFFRSKARGEDGRQQFEETYLKCKERAGRLFNVSPEEIAFLSSTSEGINLLAHALEWEPGDNVVVADVEFPSDVLPWTVLERQGVELRLVRHRNWKVSVADLESHIDSRTRVVAISLVSFLTGQRQLLRELSRAVRSTGALLSVDATHAAGVVPVEAGLADFVMSSCYKWLLGTHGVSIFYWNRSRLPDLKPPFLGWHTPATLTGWRHPTRYEPRPDAARFEPGNPSWISVYILENALGYLSRVGVPEIESYVLDLSERVLRGLAELGLEIMTPSRRRERAGNACFVAPREKAVMRWMDDRGILVWGDSQRIRVSTHLYNTADDVEEFLEALRRCPLV